MYASVQVEFDESCHLKSIILHQKLDCYLYHLLELGPEIQDVDDSLELHPVLLGKYHVIVALLNHWIYFVSEFCYFQIINLKRE